MKTALYETHLALGAKMTEFGGWEMPIQYKGIIHEHLAVRTKAGIFDVSHMGRIIIEGSGAEELLDYLSTNTISGKKEETATYTVWCDPEGGCVDDLIVYRESREKFFVVVNASNRQLDLEHLLHNARGYDVSIVERYQQDGILSVQGPKAAVVVEALFPVAGQLNPMRLAAAAYKNEKIILSRTGYTGADGFEIFAPNHVIVELWDVLLKTGKSSGIEPIGLGARDTLRLEMGYALYGHEISQEIYPIESVSAWTVKCDKRDFVGKAALEKAKILPKIRSEYGIVLKDKGIAREDYEVFLDGAAIGRVTSGTYSPSLNQAIAIILTDEKLHEGDVVEVKIRQNMCAAEVVKLPFLTHLARHG